MGLLDISGFFTGLILNLLLISLVCYYFKRKYENIESAQMEQAKVLYELLKKQSVEPGRGVEKIEIVRQDNVMENEWESEDDEESDEDEDEEDEPADENVVTDEPSVKVFKLDLDHSADYNKMSVRTLRDLLTNKGVKTNNKMKKNELIRLVTDKKSLVVDLAFEDNEPDEVEVPICEVPIDILD